MEKELLTASDQVVLLLVLRIEFDRDHHMRRAFAASMPGTAPKGGQGIKISEPVVNTFSRGDHL